MSLAQTTIKGLVLDATENPIPFANIYIEGTTNGTTSNLKGEFEIVTNTNQTIVISSIGFTKEKIKVTSFTTGVVKKVILKEQSIALNEVTITNSKKDPAYAIIKQAQKRRKFHLKQVEEYIAEIYMKGNMYLDEIPEFFKKMADEDELPDSSDFGLVFLTESVSKLAVKRPNEVKEKMIASKVSGTMMTGMGEFSWNRAEHVLVNFYENNVDLKVTERGFVSPIASNATVFYDYKYLGYFMDNGKMINQIKVIPRRKADPVLEGLIYIVEDDWSIHSLDLKVNKESQLEYLDSMKVKQSFQEVNEGTYMPISLHLMFFYNIMGIKVRYSALGTLTKYELNPGFPDDYFTNEQFEVQKEVKEIQDEYWVNNRPNILTDEEQTNYHKGDSIKAILESPAYRDSVDRARNKPSVLNILSGYNHQNTADSINWRINGLLEMIQWTTVDGLAIDLRPQWQKTTVTGFSRWNGQLRYSNKQEVVDGTLGWTKQFNRFDRATFNIEGGRMTQQINKSEPISPDFNTYYTLWARKNFGQFYKKDFVKASFQKEYFNGFTMNTGLEYASRSNLSNLTDYSFKKYRDTREFNPNLNAVTRSTELLTFDGEIQYVFNQKYETYPDRKRNLRSKWPTLHLNYRYAPAIEKTTFLHLEAHIAGNIGLGLVGRTNYYIAAGAFPIKKFMNLVDYKHFDGNKTFELKKSSSSFNKMAYYEYSTNTSYAHLGATHHFNGFIWNKLPLLKKLKWQTVASAKTLITENRKPYIEFSAGIENIFNLIRVDVVTSLENNELTTPVFVIGLGF